MKTNQLCGCLLLFVVLQPIVQPVGGVAMLRDAYCRQDRTLRDLAAGFTFERDGVILIEEGKPQWLTAVIPKRCFYRITFLGLMGKVAKEDVQRVASLPSIDWLDFWQSAITDEIVTPFETSQMQIHRLGFADTAITDAGVRRFRKLRGLAILDLGRTRVTGECLKSFEGSSLECVALNGTHLNDEMLRSLQFLPRLENVVLDDCRITQRGWAHIAAAGQLKELDLADTGADDAAVRCLASLRNLTRLDLSRARLTDVSLAVIGNMAHLRDLNLTGTSITDSGLANLQCLQHLEMLYLDDTAIGDVGVAKLHTLNNLCFLSLDNTRVTDRALDYIAGIKSMRSLFLKNTTITPERINRLKQERPSIEVRTK